MDFAEFKSWALKLNSSLDGKPPALVEWRELLARMEAVELASSPLDVASLPAPPDPEAQAEMTTAEALEYERQAQRACREDPAGYQRWQDEHAAEFPNDGEDDFADAPAPPVDPDTAERLGATAAEAILTLRKPSPNRRAGRR